MLDINWNLVPSAYRFAAMDDDGEVYLYTSRPEIRKDYGVWDLVCPASEYADFLISTDLHKFADWKNSLTERE